MTDGDLLLKAVLADPADNDVRLVYADWLEENGKAAQGQFIRGHIAGNIAGDTSDVSWVPDCVPTPFTDVLQVLFDDPHNARRGAPGSEHDARGALPYVGLFVTRGFVEVVKCPLDRWIQHGRQMVKMHPVREVIILDRYPFRDNNPSDPVPWFWVMEEMPYNTHDLQPSIFRYLTPVSYYSGGNEIAEYATAQDALADLRRACLLFAHGEE